MFGSAAIKLTNANGTCPLLYSGGENFSNTTALTVLLRFKPDWTGNPSTRVQLMNISASDGGGVSGLQMAIFTDGALWVQMLDKFRVSVLSTELTMSSPFNFQSGVPIDIWFVWDGTATAGHVKVYAANNGNAPTLIGSTTASAACGGRDKLQTGPIILGIAPTSGGEVLPLLNEFVIWDTAEDPTSYGIRTGFIPTTSSAFQGYTYTDPGASHVVAPGSGGPTNYVFNGTTEVGTYVPPLPAATDLRAGTVVGTVTGTLNLTTAANIKHGVTQDNGAIVGIYTGADLWTAFGAGQIVLGQSSLQNGATITGTAIVAAKATTVIGTTANDGPGQAVAAAAVTTKHGVTANDGVGSYRGADLWSDPGAGSVVNPAGGGPANYLANGVVIVGTFAVDSTNPGAQNVKINVPYNINGTDYVGTYDLFSTAGVPGDDAMAQCLEGLAEYLENIAGLTVLREFPYANEQLAYPSITITAGTPKLMPQMPYEVSRTTPDGQGKILVNMVTGAYDTSFQLDLWCRDKKERKNYLDLIKAAFDAQAVDASGKGNPSGLSLQLSSYFNEYARFEIDTHTHVDDEAAAQRQERRERIAVIVNCREIRSRTYYAIQQIQGYSQATEKDVVFTDDTTDTELYNFPTE
jgi:hypothetical protein